MDLKEAAVINLGRMAAAVALVMAEMANRRWQWGEPSANQ